jgi:hypothetical protein
MKRIVLLAVGGGLLIALAAGFLVFTSQTNNPDAGSLGKKAMEGATLPDRLTAATELSNFPGDEAVAEMDRLVKESPDSEVVARVIPSLSVRKPTAPTAELLFEKLNHADAAVREAAFDGLKMVVRLTKEDKASFVVDDPPSKREAAAKALKEKYKSKPLRGEGN